jgi:6-pyruvoyltetrahydropterin/6-carboxytetrahydropterin synthase
MTGQNGAWRLRVSSQFSSSHQLRHYQGKCENLHGHNFTVEAEVEGNKLDPDTGILIDFKELKSKLTNITEGLDHCHLNDLPQFKEENPSSEHIARFIFKELQKSLAHNSVQVCSITVSEKDSSKAIYFE